MDNLQNTAIDLGMVSVIIPTYNRSSQVKACIKSVLDSSYTNMEIILVDNASTEDISSVAASFDSKKIVYVKLRKNKMAAGGRNAGIRRAKGDYLLFLDSDNVVDQFMIEKLVEAVYENDEIGMIGPLMMYNKLKNRVWFAGGSVNLITSRMNCLSNTNNAMFEMDKGYRFIRTGHLPNCMMITREVQEKVGYFDESYYIMFEEADYAARVSRAGGEKSNSSLQ